MGLLRGGAGVRGASVCRECEIIGGIDAEGGEVWSVGWRGSKRSNNLLGFLTDDTCKWRTGDGNDEHLLGSFYICGLRVSYSHIILTTS